MRTSISSALLVLFVLALGCAEQRPIEKHPDGDQQVLAKDIFYSEQSDQDVKAQSLLGNGNVWYSKVTVVRTSNNGGPYYVGFQSQLKAGQFKFSREQLRFENVNSINNGDESVVGELIASWNIQHHDTRLIEVDGRPTGKEEPDHYKSWQQKKFFRVDWSDTDIAEASTFPFHEAYMKLDWLSCWQRKNAQVVGGSREISKDYVSFTVAVDYELNAECGDLRRHSRGDYTFTAHFKYSFMKAKVSNYHPMAYNGEFDPAMKKYGFMQTVVETKGTEYPQKLNILVNRWHPNKTHTFYFADDFPEQWKWLYNHPQKGIFAKTNALFAKNGLNNFNAENGICTTGLCFEIKDNDGTKKFGDLRYSFVKIVDEADPEAPFGYGPSDANPFTGEIISANSVLWTGYLEFFVKALKQNTKAEAEDHSFLNSSLIKQMARTLGTEGKIDPSQYRSAWTHTAEKMRTEAKAEEVYLQILPEFTYGYPGWSRFTDRPGLGMSSPAGEKQLPGLLKQDIFSGVEAHPMSKELVTHEKFSQAKSAITNFVSFYEQGHNHQRNSTIYMGEAHLGDAFTGVLAGKSKDQVIDSIMSRVAIHEFGHNLNLRHNFYGSVDRKHFREGSDHKHGTSSVMDYQHMRHFHFAEEQWEAYDEAALVYAYSGGSKDLGKIKGQSFLYCSDEHTILNALCNAWDAGTTPSEIALHMVEDYDLLYAILNQRFERPYWNTSNYARVIAKRMYAMKKFLGLLDTSMILSDLETSIGKSGLVSSMDVRHNSELIWKDVVQANKIAVAFFDGVINYKRPDKDFLSDFDPWSGETKRIGIALDKIIAMYFLMGDNGILYNTDPKRDKYYSSYVEYAEGHPLSPVVDRALQNTFTARIDMDPGFEGFGRILYALNAYNYTNRANTALFDRIRVDCFTPDSFESQLGIPTMKPSSNSGHKERNGWGLVELEYDQIDQEKASDYFQVAGTGEKVGYVFIEGNYYVTKQFSNSYTYAFVKALIDRVVDSQSPGSLEPVKAFIRDSFEMYWGEKLGGEVGQCR